MVPLPYFDISLLRKRVNKPKHFIFHQILLTFDVLVIYFPWQLPGDFPFLILWLKSITAQSMVVFKILPPSHFALLFSLVNISILIISSLRSFHFKCEQLEFPRGRVAVRCVALRERRVQRNSLEIRTTWSRRKEGEE